MDASNSGWMGLHEAARAGVMDGAVSIGAPCRPGVPCPRLHHGARGLAHSHSADAM